MCSPRWPYFPISVKEKYASFLLPLVEDGLSLRYGPVTTQRLYSSIGYIIACLMQKKAAKTSSEKTYTVTSYLV